MTRPRRTPPPPTEWYEDNRAAPFPGDIEKVCANCGRTFYTSAKRKFPSVQEPKYCSRACKTQADNFRYYWRHRARR